MCGICGFVGYGSITDLKNINDAMAHRGPDDEGSWYDENRNIYLGQRRLSIIDIECGHQPMWTSDGNLGVVFNGEIYNYIELRHELELRGHEFKTDHSDTEILLHGYREWGKNLPNKLNGMWAFSIYDRRMNILFLSRDRFGKKPLFYTYQNGTFAYASELSALLMHSNIKCEISKRSLKKYFAYGYIPAPNSLYEDVYKLPGGYNLEFDIDNHFTKTYKYWDYIIEPFENIPQNPEVEWGEELRSLLEKAVKRRLISDVPLGVFLSGGIDSSAITAFASKALGGSGLKTFSIGFDESSFDETEYAKRVSEQFNTDHYCETLSMDKAKTLAEHIINKLDEPMGDSSLIPTYLLCQVARKKVTVALGGDGGDEIFAGYDPFKALRLAEFYSTVIPKPVHIAILLLAGKLPTSFNNISSDFKIKRTLRGLLYPKKIWNPVWMGPLDPSELEMLFGEKSDIEDIYSEAINFWDSCKSQNIIDRTLQFFTKLYLQDDILVKADRASMMNSLEVRSPFLDIELVDFARKIPHQYKYRNGETKYILKKALEPVLPLEILYRSKKGFGVPIGKWFKSNMLTFEDKYINKFLQSEFLCQKMHEHLNGSQDNRLYLWNHWVLNKSNIINKK